MDAEDEKVKPVGGRILRLYRILPVVCAVMMIPGCAGMSQDVVPAAAVQQTPTEAPEPEDPVIEGKVLTNYMGYESDAQKLVIFRENHETEQFEVIEEESGEVVYRGTILENEYNAKSEEFAAYGDFSKVTEPGSYYVNAGEYGRSVNFIISDTLYSELLGGQIDYFLKQSEQTEAEEDAAIKAADILLSYTYFESQYEESDAEKMPELLKEAKKELDVLLKSKKQSGINTAALAMSVEVFAPFDKEYSEECLTKAEESFAELNQDQIEGDRFWAAAELYKLTGKSEYATVIDEYLKEQEPRGFGKTAVGYYGTLAYLTTTYKTNVDKCTELMEQLFNDAIEIVEESSADGYKISLSDNYKEEDAELLLQNARLLTLMNIISKSQDYVLGVENHLDYLCGRNPFETNYLSEENEMYGKESFIFILSGLKDSYESEETEK